MTTRVNRNPASHRGPMAETKIAPPVSPRRVLLLHASLKALRWGSAWRGTESLTPPLGLMHLGGPLLRRGHEVVFVDLNVDRYEEAAFRVLLARQDFVLITVYSDSLASVMTIMPMIASCNPHAFILCGGPYCTLSQYPVSGAHLTVVGEAEQHIVEMVDALAAGRSLEHLPGLMLARDGRVRRTEGILRPDNLDDGVNASWELARDKDYGYFFGARLEGMTLVMSSRGCPYRCTYCTLKGVLPYRERSVDNVLAELRTLSQRGVRLVIFDDDNLLLNRKRTLAILGRAAAERLCLRFIVQGRVDCADLAF